MCYTTFNCLVFSLEDLRKSSIVLTVSLSTEALCKSEPSLMSIADDQFFLPLLLFYLPTVGFAMCFYTVSTDAECKICLLLYLRKNTV